MIYKDEILQEEVNSILDMVDKSDNKSMRGFLKNAQLIYYKFMIDGRGYTFKEYIDNTIYSFKKAFEMNDKESCLLVLGTLVTCMLEQLQLYYA